MQQCHRPSSGREVAWTFAASQFVPFLGTEAKKKERCVIGWLGSRGAQRGPTARVGECVTKSFRNTRRVRKQQGRASVIDCNSTAPVSNRKLCSEPVRAHAGAGHVFHLILSLKTLNSQSSTTSPLLLQPDVLVSRGNAPEARPC